MYQVKITGSYKKDFKRAMRRNEPMQQLRRVLDTLARGEPLSPIHRDHGLKADYNKARACHIRGDWCLIYRIDEESNSLILIRLGTHSDLYNE